MSGYPEYSDGRGISLYHEGPGVDPHRHSANANSYYNHPSRAPSTQSWVTYNLQHPPPPPDDDEPTPHPTPQRAASRPLPDPAQYMQYNSQYSHNPTVLRLTNPTMEDDEEYMNIEPQGSGTEEYPTESTGRPPVRRVPVPAPPVDFQTPTMRYEDVGPLRQEDPEESPRRFVGGFFSGLRRLPRVLMRRGSSKKKKSKKEKASYGEGYDLDSGSPTRGADLERGNTLPLYTENPGPNVSRPVYVEGTEMPTPMRAEYSMNLPPSISARPRQGPSWHVTPPSDIEEQNEDIGMTPEIPHTMPGGMVQSPPPETIPEENEPPPQHPEHTVTVYDLPQEDRYSALPASEPPATPPPVGPPVIPPPVIPMPSGPPTIRNSRSRSSRGGRSSRREPAPAPASPPPSTAPVQAHPMPTSDYRKMGAALRSRTSYTTDLSDGPSFTEQTNPLFRFVRALWYMPWVAQGPQRVTVDYAPAGRGKGSKYGIAVSKKPSRSWYRGTPGVVMSPRSSNSIDLLSPGGVPPTAASETAAKRISTVTTRTQWHPAPTNRPTRRRATEPPRRHGHRRPHHRPHHRTTHRHDRRRDTTSSSATTTTQITQYSAFPIQPPSPVLPAVYPFPYPFPYGYAPYQHQQAPAPERSKSSIPRGPRPHRHGYPSYQPFAAPQPMYFIQSHSPPGSSGDGSGPGQPQQMFVPMQFIPGAFNGDGVVGAVPAQGNTSR